MSRTPNMVTKTQGAPEKKTTNLNSLSLGVNSQAFARTPNPKKLDEGIMNQKIGNLDFNLNDDYDPKTPQMMIRNSSYNNDTALFGSSSNKKTSFDLVGSKCLANFVQNYDGISDSNKIKSAFAKKNNDFGKDQEIEGTLKNKHHGSFTEMASRMNNKNLKDIKVNPFSIQTEGTNKKEHLEVHKVDNLITSQERKSTIPINITNTNETDSIKTFTNTEEIKDFYVYTEECMKRIVNLKVPEDKEIQHLLVDLPFHEELKTKKLAVFDLDETLVHCEIRDPSKGEVQLQVNLPNGQKAKIGINFRPYMKKCLENLQDIYVVIVYTASHQSYADSVLDFIDAERKLIKYRLYRHNCVRVQMEEEFIYVKDLRIFRNIDLKDIVIIDNSVLSFSFQLNNGIPIMPFYDNKSDNELECLENYLKFLAKSADVRKLNQQTINMDFFLSTAKTDLDNSLLGDDHSSLTDDYNSNDNNYTKLNETELKQSNSNNIIFLQSNSNLEESFDHSVDMNESGVSKQQYNSNDSNRSDYSPRDELSHQSRYNYKIVPPMRKPSVFKDRLFSTLDDFHKNFQQMVRKTSFNK